MSRVRRSDAVSNQVQSYHQHSKASYDYARKEIAREHRVLQECYIQEYIWRANMGNVRWRRLGIISTPIKEESSQDCQNNLGGFLNIVRLHNKGHLIRWEWPWSHVTRAPPLVMIQSHILSPVATASSSSIPHSPVHPHPLRLLHMCPRTWTQGTHRLILVSKGEKT